MKKILLWMVAAIITCCGTNLIISCSNDDEPSVEYVIPAQTDQPGAFGVYLKKFKIETPSVDFQALTL